ncbi:MAG: ABC transporter ATP-binding protein [Acholeplasmataceae bacterium]|jgi:ABC-2 type transport system ATP-binding protein|nr:ABC transporter ATP-binding protein [Acholeplasmataceae bacterium]
MEEEVIIMIDIVNISKSFDGYKALQDVSFQLTKGEIVGFIGKNGAGKTTCINIIMGLLHPDSGYVELNHSQSNHPLRIGYLPENPSFYPWMTPVEFLNYHLGHHNFQYIEQLLDFVGLKEHQHRRIKGFSRGMRQRLGIAVALIHQPEILILDEPASALDPQGRNDILNIIIDLKKKGLTILFSSHILSDVEKVCDRVIMIHKGKIIKTISMHQLSKQYMTDVLEITFQKEPMYEHIINLTEISGIKSYDHQERTLKLTLINNDAYFKIMDYLSYHKFICEKLAFSLPELDDLFLKEVMSYEK